MKPSSQDEEDKEEPPSLTGEATRSTNVVEGNGDKEGEMSSSGEPNKEQEMKLMMMGAVEDHFLCPITHEVMRDPVTDREGNTWERDAILQWIRSHNQKSPKTGNILRERDLVPNRILRNFIASVFGSEYVQESSSGGEDFTSCPNDISCREKVNEFLAFIGELSGQDLKLNDEGLCALEYQDLLIVVDVPTESNFFYMYSAVAKEVNPSEEESHILKTAMLLNHLQIETRGGNLGLDPVKGEIVFCLREREKDVDANIFRNILENFIDKAMEIRTKLRQDVTSM